MKIVWMGVACVLGTSPLFAQGVPVFDTLQIAAIVKVLAEVQQTYGQLNAQYTTIQQMRTPMTGLQRYRLPAVPMGFHNTGAFPFGGGVLGAMNTGNDPDGHAWYAASHPLQKPTGLPPEVQPHYANVELLDSTAVLAGWTVGQSRQYHGELQTRIDSLQDDTVNGVHEPTANLDRLTIANVLRSRQQMTHTQLQSSLVDQLIAQEKVKRDSEVEGLNMQLVAIQKQGMLTNMLTGGAGNLLRKWVLP